MEEKRGGRDKWLLRASALMPGSAPHFDCLISLHTICSFGRWARLTLTSETEGRVKWISTPKIARLVPDRQPVSIPLKLSSGPVVKNLHSNAGDMDLIPVWGTKIPHAVMKVWHSHKWINEYSKLSRQDRMVTGWDEVADGGVGRSTCVRIKTLLFTNDDTW